MLEQTCINFKFLSTQTVLSKQNSRITSHSLAHMTSS